MKGRRTLPVVVSAIVALVLILSVFDGSFVAGAQSATPAPALAAGGPTRMLGAPAVSGDHIAFVYASDVWVADLSGANPRRLTIDGAALITVGGPTFSPDGQQVVYSAMYNRNVDVYAVPVTGGQPRRLTWHSADDLALGFTPDGKNVLFSSDRAAKFYIDPYAFTVPLNGGFPQQLVKFNIFRATYSPDGTALAYNPLDDAFIIWKGYRGGLVSVISIYQFADQSSVKIPQPPTHCNDVGPMWIGGRIYFRSDRNGEFNLYSYDTKTQAVEQLTHHTDFPVLNASSDGQTIVYEQAGRIHRYDLAKNESTPIDIRIATDLPQTVQRFARGASFIRGADISPSGARAVFETRGEIVTVPADKGDPRNLTHSPGVNDRSPAWSPDGKWVAYFSDESGEYELVLRNQDGTGEPRRFKMTGSGYYDSPGWAPKGNLIAFLDNAGTLSYLDTDTGEQHKVATDAYIDRGVDYGWSPDGRWIAYTQEAATSYKSLYLYSLDDGRSTRVTDGLADVGQPAFDADGKYLYFRMSTNSGPTNANFDMSSFGLRSSDSIYVAILAKSGASPLAVQSDEETPTAEGSPTPTATTESGPTPGPTVPSGPTPAATATGSPTPVPTSTAPRVPAAAAPTGQPTGGPSPSAPGTATVTVTTTVTPEAGKTTTSTMTIDLEGLQQRAVPLQIAAAMYDGILPGEAGKIYYLKLNADTVESGRPSGQLMRYDLKQRKEDMLLDGVQGFAISADGSTLLVNGAGWQMLDVSGPGRPEPTSLDVGAIQLRVDPRAEWQEMYTDAWRINRDFFYDPYMDGVDWNAMRVKYEQCLPDLATRSDLNRVIAWLFSELRVSHHEVYGGDVPAEANPIPVGLLGADYSVENGRYRFAKVYGGFAWYPRVQAPLAEPGSLVTAGEYLLDVNGESLQADENIYNRFENTVGKVTAITVGPNPNGEGSRTINVTPIDDESVLRKLDWIESTRLKVDQASGGKIAYVYMPDTGVSGYNLFNRYYFPQSDKPAIILDDRFNQGGQYANYVIDYLRRQPAAWYTQRYGGFWGAPGATIAGPKVMLINEASASGGDLMPWVFQRFEVGKLIGKRSWGGLVGISYYPPLLDGGRVTAPDLAFFDQKGWIVENVGVTPDIEVDPSPAQVEAGQDPQIDRAVNYLLDELKAHPAPVIQKPPYPDKTK